MSSWIQNQIDMGGFIEENAPLYSLSNLWRADTQAMITIHTVLQNELQKHNKILLT